MKTIKLKDFLANVNIQDFFIIINGGIEIPKNRAERKWGNKHYSITTYYKTNEPVAKAWVLSIDDVPICALEFYEEIHPNINLYKFITYDHEGNPITEDTYVEPLDGANFDRTNGVIDIAL